MIKKQRLYDTIMYGQVTSEQLTTHLSNADNLKVFNALVNDDFYCRNMIQTKHSYDIVRNSAPALAAFINGSERSYMNLFTSIYFIRDFISSVDNSLYSAVFVKYREVPYIREYIVNQLKKMCKYENVTRNPLLVLSSGTQDNQLFTYNQGIHSYANTWFDITAIMNPKSYANNLTENRLLYQYRIETIYCLSIGFSTSYNSSMEWRNPTNDSDVWYSIMVAVTDSATIKALNNNIEPTYQNPYYYKEADCNLFIKKDTFKLFYKCFTGGQHYQFYNGLSGIYYNPCYYVFYMPNV